jgi:hypothetical protein
VWAERPKFSVDPIQCELSEVYFQHAGLPPPKYFRLFIVNVKLKYTLDVDLDLKFLKGSSVTNSYGFTKLDFIFCFAQLNKRLAKITCT